MKKFPALLLALLLLLGAMTGCGASRETTGEEPESTPASESEIAEEKDEGASSGEADEEDPYAEYLAAYEAYVEKVRAAAGTYAAEEVVGNIEDIPVTWGLFYYYLSNNLNDLFVYTGGLPENFDEPLSDEITLGDYIIDNAAYFAKLYAAAELMARDYGVELTEDQLAAIDEEWESMVAYYGDEAAAIEAIGPGMTKEGAYYLLRGNLLLDSLMKELYGAAGEKLSEEEVVAWGEENGYVLTKHILYYFEDEEGNELDEDGKAALLEKVSALREELSALGEDPDALEKRFDEIMNAESADTGGVLSYPDGYTFTAGTMVEPFETAAFALEPYGLSAPVESAYGYHLILRLPLRADGLTMDTNSGTGGSMTLRESAANDMFNTLVIERVNGEDLVYTDDFSGLDLNELFGIHIVD